MRKGDAIALFKVLNECKLSGMGIKGKMAALSALRATRPVRDAFEADMREASEKLKGDPARYDDMERRAREHNVSVQTGGKARMSADELIAASREITRYNRELSEYERASLDAEADIRLDRIGEDDLGKLMEANDIKAGDLEIIYSNLRGGE